MAAVMHEALNKYQPPAAQEWHASKGFLQNAGFGNKSSHDVFGQHIAGLDALPYARSRAPFNRPERVVSSDFVHTLSKDVLPVRFPLVGLVALLTPAAAGMYLGGRRYGVKGAVVGLGAGLSVDAGMLANVACFPPQAVETAPIPTVTAESVTEAPSVIPEFTTESIKKSNDWFLWQVVPADITTTGVPAVRLSGGMYLNEGSVGILHPINSANELDTTTKYALGMSLYGSGNEYAYHLISQTGSEGIRVGALQLSDESDASKLVYKVIYLSEDENRTVTAVEEPYKMVWKKVNGDNYEFFIQNANGVETPLGLESKTAESPTPVPSQVAVQDFNASLGVVDGLQEIKFVSDGGASEVVDLTKETFFHQDTAVAKVPVEGTNIPLEVTIYNADSLYEGTGLKDLPLGFDSWFSPTGRDTSSSSSSEAEKVMIDGWSNFVYFTFIHNSTPEEVAARTNLFGKPLENVTYEEYWKAVDAYLHQKPYNGQDVHLDHITYRVFTNVENETDRKIVNVDPTKNGSLTATGDQKDMTIIKLNDVNHRIGYGSVVRSDGTLDIRVYFPTGEKVDNSVERNLPFINAMNRLTFPVYQDEGEVDVDTKYFGNEKTYNPGLFNAMIVDDPSVGLFGPIGVEAQFKNK